MILLIHNDRYVFRSTEYTTKNATDLDEGCNDPVADTRPDSTPEVRESLYGGDRPGGSPSKIIVVREVR